MKAPKTKSRAPKGVEKKPTLNKEFIKDFKKAYFKVINDITNERIHDEDSANNYYNTEVKNLEEVGCIKILYQPGKKDSDDLVEEGHFLFFFSNPIRKVEKDEMKKIMKEAEQILISDYHSMKKDCNGKWYQNYKSETFDGILDITKPFQEIKKNTWKLSFRPLDDVDGKGSRGWIPKKIQEFLGIFDQEWYDEIVEKISE